MLHLQNHRQNLNKVCGSGRKIDSTTIQDFTSITTLEILPQMNSVFDFYYEILSVRFQHKSAFN